MNMLPLGRPDYTIAYCRAVMHDGRLTTPRLVAATLRPEPCNRMSRLMPVLRNASRTLAHLQTRDDSAFPLAPRLTTSDGWSVSIQANRGAYCTPRQNDGPWTTVELGFPSAAEPLIAEYAEDASDLTGTVYGYVSVALVDIVLEAHEIAARYAAECPAVHVAADKLRTLGILRSDSHDANTWTNAERLALVRELRPELHPGLFE